MRKYIYIAIAAAVAFLAGLSIWEGVTLHRMRYERDRYQRNSNALLAEVEQYKVRDSLSAARVEGLELSLSEFKKFRSEDAALIKDLRAKVRELERVSTTQTVTEYVMSAPVHDTIIIRDSVPIAARAVHCGDAWYDFDGVVTDSTFEGRMQSRDSLLIAETVQYRRFWGFLWRTRRVKSRTIDITSKNPHSTVEGAEIITIKK